MMPGEFRDRQMASRAGEGMKPAGSRAMMQQKLAQAQAARGGAGGAPGGAPARPQTPGTSSPGNLQQMLNAGRTPPPGGPPRPTGMPPAPGRTPPPGMPAGARPVMPAGQPLGAPGQGSNLQALAQRYQQLQGNAPPPAPGAMTGVPPQLMKGSPMFERGGVVGNRDYSKG